MEFQIFLVEFSFVSIIVIKIWIFLEALDFKSFYKIFDSIYCAFTQFSDSFLIF